MEQRWSQVKSDLCVTDVLITNEPDSGFQADRVVETREKETWMDTSLLTAPVTDSQAQELPRLLIATRLFGASGQPWLARQVRGFRQFRSRLVCWENRSSDTALNGSPIYIMPGDPAPYDGAGRWRHRFKNLWRRNFYASVGQERQILTELFRREASDVALCYFGDIAMRLLPVARQRGVPVVAYLHGDFLFLTNRWYRLSLLRCLRHFAAFVVVTHAERDWLSSRGVPTDRVHVIPCGAPVDAFRSQSRSPSGGTRFVMTSRLVDEKGCDLSIEAFSQFASEFITAELHIYGDGPAREELERLVQERALTGRVTFHGYVGERELAAKLPEFDVFVQHSLRKEGSPVSIAEAMACGLPVVSTPVGGIAEQVVHGQTGFLVGEGDVRAMALAMARLAADDVLRTTMGEAGRDRAAKCYDSAVLTGRLEQVVLAVAGKE